MYISYGDLLSRIKEPPVWWLDGVPRYAPFKPENMGVYEYEVALVHTECQGCGMRYDVGTRAGRFGRTLRNLVAYQNELDIGDPPNACDFMGRNCWAGATMNSIQIGVLEYWVKGGHPIRAWRRDRSMERPLADANSRGPSVKNTKKPVLLQIYNSPHTTDWMRARDEGDMDTMTTMLRAFGCERPNEVAHMLDMERRHRVFLKEIVELDKARFGPLGMPG